MRLSLKNPLQIILLCLLVQEGAHGEESPWSLNVTGLSWHENQKQRDDANQINPGLGLRYDFSKHWYSEGNYVAKNSLSGATGTIGGGWHAEVGKISNQPFLLGTQVMWMKYQAPNRNTATGFVPAFTAEHKLTKDISLVYYLFPQFQHSVLFAGINFRL